MKYLKTSLIGISTTAALLAGTVLANAQVSGGGNMTAYGNANSAIIIPNDSSTVSAIGNAGSFTFVVPNTSLGSSQLASLNVIPANYRPGYYNYSYVAPVTVASVATPTANGSWVNGVWTPGVTAITSTATALPGVPNTGGTIVTDTNTGIVTTNGGSSFTTTGTAGNTAVFTTANPATGTFIAPSISWNGMGITGGVSVPVGYTPAVNFTGNGLVTTNNSTQATTVVSSNFYPGVPNTGGPIVNVNGYVNGNGVWNIGGQVRVNGVVTAITPNALGISSGNQTWTVTWNSGTMISTANNSANISGGQISLGDSVEVTGTIDSTFQSKINATSIRDLSFH